MKSFILAASLFFASLFGGHYPATNNTSSTVATAAAVAESQSSAPSSLVAASGLALASSSLSPNTSSAQCSESPVQAVIARGEVLGSSTQAGYVTQEELTAQLNDLRSLIYQIAATSSSAFTDPQIAANGDGVYYGDAAAPVTQLSNVTVSGISGLTASDIPPLNYFPATSTISIAFGGTGTSTGPAANELMLSDANGNWEYVATSSLGISSGVTLTGTAGEVAYFGGTNSAVGTSSLSIAQSGNVGVGTTSPSALFTVDSNSTTGTILRMSNNSIGGHVYDFLETGSANTGGAGRLDFFDKTAGAARLSIAAGAVLST
jgi:hypothetical protein